MFSYAGQAHAAILSAIEHLLPERDDAMPITALRDEMAAIEAHRNTPVQYGSRPGAHFPGWHGINRFV